MYFPVTIDYLCLVFQRNIRKYMGSIIEQEPVLGRMNCLMAARKLKDDKNFGSDVEFLSDCHKEDKLTLVIILTI